MVRAGPPQPNLPDCREPGELDIPWVRSVRMETDQSEAGAVEPTPTSVPMISIKAVNKHFGSLHVLKDINIEVDRGQVVVVLGPSGSGKSTLCRTINRLEPIDSGTIAIDGEKLPEEGRKLAQLRSDVGMVFQSFNLFAHKTILQNVTLAPMKVRKESRDKAYANAMSLLERVGIANQADKYPAQLSGGQQQRVAIARAVAGEPALLLADEPTGNLDSVTVGQVMGLLEQINRMGTTIIMVTHDAQLARCAGRNVHIIDGQLSDVGSHALRPERDAGAHTAAG